MRKLFLSIFFISLICTSVYSQSETESYVYCELVGTVNLTGTKVRVEVDFGQETSFFKQYDQRLLKDDQGNAIKFNSMVDALNYMSSKGWIFVQAYAATDRGLNVYHWLMKKKSEAKN